MPRTAIRVSGDGYAILDITDRQIANFWAKVDRRGGDCCWPWLAYRNPYGYGEFGVVNGTVHATHVAMQLAGKLRPAGAFALHGDECDPSCVNPDHLRWGTQHDNMADAIRLGRYARLHGTKSPRAKWTEEQARFVVASPLTHREISELTGIPIGSVGHIKSGRRWPHLQPQKETSNGK